MKTIRKRREERSPAEKDLFVLQSTFPPAATNASRPLGAGRDAVVFIPISPWAYRGFTIALYLPRQLRKADRNTIAGGGPPPLHGNHDEFLREFIDNLGSVRLADEFVHVTADRRRLLVTHGDKFDACVLHARWLSHLGDVGYSLLLGMNVVFNALRRRLGFGYWSLSQAIKQRVKQATCYIGSFQEVVTRHAAQRGCAGVICGHIHTPKIRECGGVTCYNTGLLSVLRPEKKLETQRALRTQRWAFSPRSPSPLRFYS